MTKAEKIAAFDPNSPGDPNSNLYGMPFTCEEATTVVVPVPWDVTVSYSDGTAMGPDAIFEASFQVDLFDPIVQDAWKAGIAMDEMPEELGIKAIQLREKAKTYIDAIIDGDSPETNPALQAILDEVNAGSIAMNAHVKQVCGAWLDQGKAVALLGGDHSTPFGMMQALAERHESFAILQLDAHADLRDAYEGFQFSHASIMFNALTIPQISKLVQVGIRDYCLAEREIMLNNPRVKTFFDRDLKQASFTGETWQQQCARIVAELPQNVYISFDIDGLDPKLCPHTGTPVAGGFELEQAIYLLEQVVHAGKTIIALDLNEVAPNPNGEDEWDANVGARLLFRMCNLMVRSQGKA